MFEKIFGILFVKSVKKSGCTVISAKREISKQNALNKTFQYKSTRDDLFWDNRGKIYGALFNSLNGRTF